MYFFLDVDFIEIKKKKKKYLTLTLKLRIFLFFINSKLPGMSNCIHVNLRLTLHDCIIYGETGRSAILNVVNYRMVSFWSRLVSGKWINMIEDTLNRTRVGHIWLIDGSLYNTECIKTGYN